MKKLMLLLTLAIMSINSICHAFEQPDPNRWVWLNSNDKYGTWLDMHTLNFDKITNSYSHTGHDSANCWLQVYNSQDDTTMFINEIIDLKCRKSCAISITIYDKDKNIINSIDNNILDFKSIIPNSNGELVYLTVKKAKDLLDQNMPKESHDYHN